MKYLWLLFPFLGFWLGAYIFGEIITAGFYWWTIPALITTFIAWAASFIYAGDKVTEHKSQTGK